MGPPQILLVDDHTLFRSGLRLILESRLGGVEVLEAGSLEEVFAGEPPHPDIVLLDIRLPGLSGLESLFLLKRRWPGVPIVMLSSDASTSTVQQAMDRGAAGFVSKADKPETIAETIRSCLRREVLEPLPTPVPQTTQGSPELTPRQLEVLAFLSQGLPNKSIARKLDISENTVRGHVQSLLGLFQATSRSEAVYMARRQGLLD